jgi:uncharacterized radical SAM protein YgiQ
VNNNKLITDNCWRNNENVQVSNKHLPMSREEMKMRGWDYCDVILITGDAYVDHPSFGVAIIGRFLEWLGYRVGIISNPDYHDVNAFKVLGKPRLCWGITAGNLDSNLMRQTIMRRPRSDDDYAVGGKSGNRPANATIVYSAMAKQAYKDVPIILGGIEASLRRFAYYDFWQNKVKKAILFDTKADILIYGMAERSLAITLSKLNNKESLVGIPGTSIILSNSDIPSDAIILPDFDAVSRDSDISKAAYNQMSRLIFNSPIDKTFSQSHADRSVIVYPPSDPLSEEEIDAIYSLNFTRSPHPTYTGQNIPAYTMIKDSITTHRGCYSGCTFCAIGSHQGKVISSRSLKNIISEISRLTKHPDFHGTITDLGGPTANMYRTGCRKGKSGCTHRTCLYPDICKHLNTNHIHAVKLLKEASNIPKVKHLFISSGIRYDLLLADESGEYLNQLAKHHISGRLKIAPEHISTKVLQVMRKPGVEVYRRFVDKYNKCGGRFELIGYFISGHPGCTLNDMIELAIYLQRENIRPEQVQDYYPVPLTIAASIYYTGIDPITGEQLYVARTEKEKSYQRAILLCHKEEFRKSARLALETAGRADLISKLLKR